MTNPANMTSPQVHQYLGFLFYYGVYQIASKSLTISGLKQRGKFKLLAFMLTVKPYWLLVGAAYEIGEVCADITLEHLQKLFGEKKKNATENEEETEDKLHSSNYLEPISAIINYISSLLDGFEYNIVTGSDETHSYKRIIWKLKGKYKAEIDADIQKEMEVSSNLRHSESQSPLSQARERLFLDFMDFDTKEESQNHLDKHAIADETISPTFSLPPFQFTKLRSTIIIEAGDEDEADDEEEEMDSDLLTPSTSSGDWTPVEPPSTPSARPELTFEDEEEDMPSSGSLKPSNFSTPSSPIPTPAIPSSSPSPSPSSPSPTTTISGRPWHLFLVDTIYKCNNSLHHEWRTAELFNAWCSKDYWFAVTEGEIELLEKWKSWALDDRPVDQKWNW
ncbi:hypothetical protein BCON_0037g00520 [Botryotinia convoluta]|uniref:Uncharacterized protein n=1 Tax=Botryotinia convoluta TaxID=54673 RepID=A0A4Z1IF34_9HELO|nr:hypothetical protein BCON_0037g00520 [Botryotinia convoluta]